MRTTPTHRASALPRRAAAAGACLTLVLALGACSKSSKSATSSCPGTATVAFQTGLKDQLAGDTSHAQSCFVATIAADPQNKYAFYDLGLIYDNAGQATQAEGEYNQAIAIDPKFDLALYNLGRLTAQGGNDAGAISLYKRAIEANPKDAKAHYNLGLLYRHQHQTAQGNAEVQTAVALDPTLTAGAQAQGVPLPGK